MIKIEPFGEPEVVDQLLVSKLLLKSSLYQSFLPVLFAQAVWRTKF